MLLIVVGMVYTIRSQIIGYINNPILMSLSGKIISAWDIPFPAITFCSDNPLPPSVINISKLFMASKSRNLTHSE